MAKSDTKKIGSFMILALLLAAVLGWFYFTSRTAVAATQAGGALLSNPTVRKAIELGAL